MTELGIARGPDVRTETRTDVTASYIDLLTDSVTGSESVRTWAAAAVEFAAGTWARALSSAHVDPSGIVDARWLAEVGRDLARKGEAVYLFDTSRGRPRLLRAVVLDVSGDSPDPDDWHYRLTLQGPRSTRTVTAPARAVFHVRYGTEAYSPARGVPPLVYASLTGTLQRNLERSVGYEAAADVAQIIPLPAGHQQTVDEDADEPPPGLIADLRAAKGRTCFPETTAAGYDDEKGAPRKDFDPKRAGPNPPAALVTLRRDVECSILAAFGIGAPLGPAGLSDGTAAREAARRLWSMTISPLAALVAAELSKVLERPVTLSHARPAGWTDIAARARAVHVLTESGIDLDEAKLLVGWDSP